MGSSGGSRAMPPPRPALLALTFSLAFASTAAAPPPIDPLVKAGVITDVIDAFVPSEDVAVRYGGTPVVDGCSIRPSGAAKPPVVQIGRRSRASGGLYTLIMADPDAPSPSEPLEREWLHWIVVDIPEGCDATKGKEVVRYAGPTPPAGIHRYVFVIFRQRGPLEGIKPPESRGKFKTRMFAAEYGLGLPVAALYFNATKEPASVDN